MTFILIALTCAMFGASFTLLTVGRQKSALAVAVAGLAVAVINAAHMYW